MSAAEPVADPTRRYVNTNSDAAVIPLSQRRRNSGGVLRAVRGWRDTMTADASSRTTPSGDQPADPLAAFAETIERSFLDIGRSLTDPETAAVYLRTLDLCARALEGSQAQGIIDAGQLAELQQVIEGMRQAPRLA